MCCEYLGFCSGLQMITNCWDIGHLIQLSLADVLLHRDSLHAPKYQEIMGHMYRMMTAFKDNKDGMSFDETSHELRHPTLIRRSEQKTRWARADLGVKKNFFRNAPTIYICLGKKMEEFRVARNNTGQKEILVKLKQLTDPDFWLYQIG